MANILQLRSMRNPSIVNQNIAGPVPDIGCAPCSGVKDYNQQFVPDCDFIPMHQPNQTPTNTIPPQQLQLTRPPNTNQQTNDTPINHDFNPKPPPSTTGGGQTNIRNNPVIPLRPPINPTGDIPFQGQGGKPCPPNRNSIVTQTPQKKTPVIPKQGGNRGGDNNNCSNPCGTQGDIWNNTGAPIQALQYMQYPISQPTRKFGLSPNNSDQPILQSGLRRSSRLPDDRCTPTDGGQTQMSRPIKAFGNFQPSVFTGMSGAV